MHGIHGEFVGLVNGSIPGHYKCAFVAEKDAMVFDGRDNEDMKLNTYQAVLGPLTVEILPQVK